MSLTNVTPKAAAYKRRKVEALEARKELDAEILAARTAGASYRAIADAAMLSLSWVQGSLARSGYQPEGRVRGA